MKCNRLLDQRFIQTPDIASGSCIAEGSKLWLETKMVSILQRDDRTKCPVADLPATSVPTAMIQILAHAAASRRRMSRIAHPSAR